ncbi:flagellar basal-body MS-ring/collar protein FliF [Moritella viscosa]|uniref:Flagellar M-ring protein n=2 Tax=Moritella viscosa TaxID=80854 RepID=A0ABY1H7I0_9GAMM|nr:flagellar basal-body MS-ring/collar protein FliF [Moritella viscosa]CED58780.1 polar flagellar M-ring protein FliF [Moritella viscosa]SGY83664.1 Flagellar M-ring protein [Moritella viscosa]SGY84213.1 Flagellar M-ring protein [Moritella viscosa]SGY85170.1 Flagellar M-ring protein [Moritella viscosa]SHN97829.1 Flagellar M-ring protein [Moritella viscosa]
MDILSQETGLIKNSSAGNGNVIKNMQSRLKLTREKFYRFRSLFFIGLLSSLIAAVIVASLWTAEQYVPLYGKQEMYDKANILELLEQQKADFQLDRESGQILVAKNQLAQLRMALAALGVKKNIPMGMGGLEGKMGLGTSQFMESKSYRFALEGELALSIITIDTVRNARVHLALPERTLFIGRDEEQASASVMLDLQPGRELSQGQVSAIINLVANSVTNMKPDNISVVDQAGRLLTLSGSQSSNRGQLATQQVTFTHDLEARLTRRISDLLYPLVGADNFRIQLTADLDFNEVEETVEMVSPETVLTKENIREQVSGDVNAVGIPGSLSNLPPVKKVTKKGKKTASSKAESSMITKRNDYSKEYVVGRSVMHKKHEFGRINNLSVSVILNNKIATGTEGWSDDELAKISSTIKNAIGMIASRGDQFNISGYDFIAVPETTLEGLPWWQMDAIQAYLRYIVITILGLTLIIFVIRPLIKNFVSQSRETENAALALTDQKSEPKTNSLSSDIKPDEISKTSKAVDMAELTAVEVPTLPAPGSEFSVQLNHLQILADKEAVRVAEVLKGWVKSNGGSQNES